MAHIWLYLAAVLLNAVNLFLQVFFAVMFADLESDYINPVDLCSKLNVVSSVQSTVYCKPVFN